MTDPNRQIPRGAIIAGDRGPDKGPPPQDDPFGAFQAEAGVTRVILCDEGDSLALFSSELPSPPVLPDGLQPPPAVGQVLRSGPADARRFRSTAR